MIEKVLRPQFQNMCESFLQESRWEDVREKVMNKEMDVKVGQLKVEMQLIKIQLRVTERFIMFGKKRKVAQLLRELEAAKSEYRKLCGL